ARRCGLAAASTSATAAAASVAAAAAAAEAGDGVARVASEVRCRALAVRDDEAVREAQHAHRRVDRVARDGHPGPGRRDGPAAPERERPPREEHSVAGVIGVKETVEVD